MSLQRPPDPGTDTALPSETDARRLSNEVRVSELRYRRLFEAARDGIFLLDIDSLEITDANPFMTELLGYPRSELIGKELWELGAFSDREASKDAFHIIQKDGYLRYDDLPLKTKQGELRQVEFVSNVYDEGDVQVIQCNIRDITQRKELEGQQVATDLRFRTLFEYAPDGILIACPENYYLEANASMCQMLGYSREELIGMHAENIVIPSEVKNIEKALDEIQSATHHHRVWQFRRKDGSDFPGEVHVTEMPDGNLLAMIRDISNRVASGAHLSRSRTNLARAQQLAHLGSWELDLPLKDGEMSPLRWSDEVFRIFGYEPGEIEVSNENFFLASHPDDRENIRSAMAKALREGSNYSLDHRVILPNGTERIVREHGEVVFDQKTFAPVKMIGTVQDITEQKRIERELTETATINAQSLALIDTILANAPIGFAFHDCNLAYVRINATLAAINGPSVEEHLGRTLREVLPNMASVIEPIMQKVISTREPEVDFPISGGTHAEPGKLKHWLVSFYPVETEGAQILGVGVLVSDVTERKRVEDEHRRQQAELRVLFDLVPAMIWFKDTENNILRINRQAAEAAGLQVDQIEGRSSTEIYPDQAAKFYEDDLRVLASRREQLGYIEMLSDPDGKKRWVQTDKVPYFDTDGKPIGIVIMAQDVTQRRNAEEALMASEVRYRSVVETAPDVIVTIDEASTICFVNPAGERIFGYSLDEMKGQSLTMLMPERLRHRHETGIERYQKTGVKNVSWEYVELSGLHKSGREIPITISFSEFVQNGHRFFTGIIRDISERKQAMEALRESEERYRKLVEDATDIIYTHDLEGNYTSVNKAAESVTGYTRDEALRMNITDTVAPECAEKAKSMMSAKLKGEEVTAYELDLIAKDGHRLTVEVNTRILFHNDKPVGVQGIARDITKRKETEAALKSSEASFKSLFDTANDAIMVLGGGVFLDCNNRAELLFGYAKHDLVGHSPVEVSPPFQPDGQSSAEKCLLYLGQALEGIPQFFEWQYKRADDTVFDAEVSLNRVDFRGATHLQAIVRDITDRKIVEAALEAAEENYRSIFENAVEGIFQSTAEGRFISANPAMARILGYDSPEELIADRVDIGTQHYVDSSCRVNLQKMLADQGVAKGYECEVFRRDRTTIWTQENIRTVRSADGELLHYEGSLEDITERKSLEGQLRQSQKMEAIGVLAGGIAHDFNNLLTAINGYSSLTLTKMAPDDPCRRNIEEVKHAGDRAAELTTQLLVFSRKQVVQPVVINVNSVVSNIERMLRRIIRESIELRVVLDPQLGNIQADSGQIEQVIMNLAINARDAMEDGGTLTVETRNVYLDEQYVNKDPALAAGDFVRMTVTDTGHGMDAATQSHIFEPFFTTKEVGKGTGLGLSTVYGIVMQSGGHVEVYSELGHGTTFKIYLPCVAERVQERRWSNEEETSAGTETILLVEDEEIVRTFVRTILSGNGYNILEASNGKEALAIAGSYPERIHMLLTDLIMPRMSGTELKDQLLKIRPDVKNLFMSGYTHESISRRGVLNTGTAFIEKPFSPEELLRKIREVLDD